MAYPICVLCLKRPMSRNVPRAGICCELKHSKLAAPTSVWTQLPCHKRSGTALHSMVNYLTPNTQNQLTFFLLSSLWCRVAEYLSFNTVDFYVCISGYKSPDTALCESMKLLSSMLITFVGKGLYGNNGNGSDVRFIDKGSDQFKHLMIIFLSLVVL